MTEKDLFQVEPQMTKHLARNVPEDFTDYLLQVERTLQHTNYRHGRRPASAVDEMARILVESPDDDFISKLDTEVRRIWLRYEALNRSVDYQISPRPVHAALSQVISNMRRAADNKLKDDWRDERVAEDRGLMTIDEFDIDAIPFSAAKTLAEKVSITRLKLLQTAEELEEIRDHFVYKGNLTTAGKPGAYSMFYAVFALGDLFVTHNEHGDKASVNTFTTTHTGRFLTFVRSFFNLANVAVSAQHGDTFPESVRKIAQKRGTDPDCYKLLDDEADTQHLLDFMTRIDRVR